MDLKSQIEATRGDAAGLERLYRQVIAAGKEEAFKEAIGQCAREYPSIGMGVPTGYSFFPCRGASDCEAKPDLALVGGYCDKRSSRRSFHAFRPWQASNSSTR
jgi:hypothetical protein